MTWDDAEMAAIKAVGFEFSEDARRTIAILSSLGLIKIRDRALDEPELQAVRDVLDEAAERLEKFSTNPLYHKAMLRGAKLIRELKHECEMRSLSTFRQGGLSSLRGDSHRTDEPDPRTFACSELVSTGGQD